MTRNILLTLSLALTLALSWPLERVNESVGKLIGHPSGYQCTAFAISPTAFITSAHCVQPDDTDIFVNEIRVFPKMVEPEPEGFAVLTGDRGLPPLKLGKRPKPGDQILLVGYGNGSPKPMAFQGVFMTEMIEPGGKGPFSFMSPAGMAGMSGSPYVNEKGQVVSVHFAGFTSDSIMFEVGLGVAYDRLAAIWGTYGKR